MKISLILFIIILNITTVFGQQTIVTVLDENGKLTGQSITKLDSISAEQIYKKAEEWVAYTFTNTESVTQAKIENKMIRLKGISKSAIGPFMGYYFDLSYQIQIDIKEENIRFTITNLKQVAQSSPFTKTSLELFYKKGKLKKRKAIIKTKGQVDKQINLIEQSLISHITGNEEADKDDW